jgi:hypothetical protein
MKLEEMKNMSNVDRIIRVILGVALIVVLVVVQSGWRFVGLLGIVLLATSALGVCPLYMPFGIKTNKKR